MDSAPWTKVATVLMLPARARRAASGSDSFWVGGVVDDDAGFCLEVDEGTAAVTVDEDSGTLVGSPALAARWGKGASGVGVPILKALLPVGEIGAELEKPGVGRS